jgi:alkylhydroperoxidase family enzyme
MRFDHPNNHNSSARPVGRHSRRWIAFVAAGLLLLGMTTDRETRSPSASLSPTPSVSAERLEVLPREQPPPSAFALLDEAESWACLPPLQTGLKAPLPAWARILARTLPRTTASMLELDHLHRGHSTLDPELRGVVRWAAASANRSAYSKAYALADLRAAGLNELAERLAAGNTGGLKPAVELARAFAKKLTTAPREVSDAEVARLIETFGEKDAVAIVLLLAHAQFQDRLFLALGVCVEEGGPLPSLAVRFSRRSLGLDAAPPTRRPPTTNAPDVNTAAPPDWKSPDAYELQCALDAQRGRRSRIWLPDAGRGANRWGLVGQTYQPDLANAWTACTQAFGEEADQDPVFEQCVFWIVTRTKGCFY